MKDAAGTPSPRRGGDGRPCGLRRGLRVPPRRALLPRGRTPPGLVLRRPGSGHAAGRPAHERHRAGIPHRPAHPLRDRRRPRGAADRAACGRARRPAARPGPGGDVRGGGHDRPLQRPPAQHVDARPARVDARELARGAGGAHGRQPALARRRRRARARAAEQTAAGLPGRGAAGGRAHRRPAAAAAQPVGVVGRGDRARALVAVDRVAGQQRLAADRSVALDRGGQLDELAAVVGDRALPGPARQPGAGTGVDRRPGAPVP